MISVNLPSSGFATLGIFRSTNGGNTFTQISQGNGSQTGLPGGKAFDLASDSSNPSTLYTALRYAEIVGGVSGIYKSTNTGATWAKVSNAAMDALHRRRPRKCRNQRGQQRPGLRWDHRRCRRPGRPLPFRQRRRQLDGDGRSLDPPRPAGIDPLLDPGGSRRCRHRLPGRRPPGPAPVRHRRNGLDRQPGPLRRFPAARPAVRASNPQQAAPPRRRRHGTVRPPHADSREMAFDATSGSSRSTTAASYRRTNPGDNTGDWFSIIGDIQVTEFHDIAYDTLSERISAGPRTPASSQQNHPRRQNLDQTHRRATAETWPYRSIRATLVIDSLFELPEPGELPTAHLRREQLLQSEERISPSTTKARSSDGGDCTVQFVTPVESTRSTRSGWYRRRQLTLESLDQGNNVREVLPRLRLVGVNQPDAVAYGGRRDGSGQPRRPLHRRLHSKSTSGPPPANSRGVRSIFPGWEVSSATSCSTRTMDGGLRRRLEPGVPVPANAGVAWTDVTGNLCVDGPARMPRVAPPDRGRRWGGSSGRRQRHIQIQHRRPWARWDVVGTGFPRPRFRTRLRSRGRQCSWPAPSAEGPFSCPSRRSCAGTAQSPPPEVCDTSGNVGCAAGQNCNATCSACEVVPVCGDGAITPPEICDTSGNVGCAAGQTCNATCSACEAAPICGDGAITPPEVCDTSGNIGCAAGQSCNATCSACEAAPICGDGVITAPEVCDTNGNVGCAVGQSCNAACSTCEAVPVCGDGAITPPEICDTNGNVGCAAGQNCDATCSACTATGPPNDAWQNAIPLTAGTTQGNPGRRHERRQLERGRRRPARRLVLVRSDRTRHGPPEHLRDERHGRRGRWSGYGPLRPLRGPGHTGQPARRERRLRRWRVHGKGRGAGARPGPSRSR